jgi:hypothetical protein
MADLLATPPPHDSPELDVVLLPVIKLLANPGSPVMVKSTFSPKKIEPPHNSASHETKEVS